jgi:hypothetical protein
MIPNGPWFCVCASANATRWDVSTDLFAVGVVLYQLRCDGHHAAGPA